MRLQGKSAVITGAARGIGQAIAERFVEEGARVAVVDLAPGPAAEAAATLCGKAGREAATPIVADVTKSADVARMVGEAMAALGKVDILVNNAGVVRDNMIHRMPEEDFDFVVGVCLKGPWLCCRALADHFRGLGGGKIVNIASRAYLGNRGQSNYSSAKGGLVSLTRTLALEFARHQVNVNCIAPGLIDTPLVRALREDVQKALIEAQPTKRAGAPRDVANAALFLASDEATFITGQVLFVDGGKSIGGSVA
ncbi:MAG: SDR family oxidoreductase [Planctomycetes bacterium]|nr:SDR family oxidoreductase [Planctomycetota bacterium]